MTKHIHKLKRYAYKNGEKVYFCVVDDCKYKIVVGMALGKKTICNRCSTPFIMNELSIRMAKPHCNNCIKKKDEKLDTTVLTAGGREISLSNSTPVSNLTPEDPLQELRKSLIKSIGDTIDRQESQADDSDDIL